MYTQLGRGPYVDIVRDGAFRVVKRPRPDLDIPPAVDYFAGVGEMTEKQRGMYAYAAIGSLGLATGFVAGLIGLRSPALVGTAAALAAYAATREWGGPGGLYRDDVCAKQGG